MEIIIISLHVDHFSIVVVVIRASNHVVVRQYEIQYGGDDTSNKNYQKRTRMNDRKSKLIKSSYIAYIETLTWSTQNDSDRSEQSAQATVWILDVCE